MTTKFVTRHASLVLVETGARAQHFATLSWLSNEASAYGLRACLVTNQPMSTNFRRIAEELDVQLVELPKSPTRDREALVVSLILLACALVFFGTLGWHLFWRYP